MLKKCAAYLRYSSVNQTYTSIEYQRNEIEKYCKANGYEIVAEFIDEAHSGVTDNRPAFQEMIRRSQTNTPPWEVVIVYDYSRFSRNVMDCYYYLKVLFDHYIDLISTKEKFDPNNPTDSIVQFIKFRENEQASRDIGDKTHAGLKNKAQKGKHCGSRPPLGYDVTKTGNLVINANEAVIVYKIFEMYSLGYSYKRIAKYLNDKGYKTKAGRKFTKNSFYNILTQEKYIGTFRWNRAVAKDRHSKRNNHASKPIDEQIIIPHGCPAIIDQNIYDAVQARLSTHERGKAFVARKHHYMLGGMGLMKCAVCGRYMVGVTSTSHGRQYTQYSCQNHLSEGCPTVNINAAGLDKFVAMAIAKHRLKQQDIPVLNTQLKKQDEINNLTQRKASLDKSILNITKALAKAYIQPLVEELHMLNDERNKIQKEIEAYKKMTTLNKENFKKTKIKLINYLQTSDSPEVRKLISETVKMITIDNENVTIELNIA